MNANDLKQWRERLGLTQEQAAEALGLSRPTIARYEDGNEIPETVKLASFYIEKCYCYALSDLRIEIVDKKGEVFKKAHWPTVDAAKQSFKQYVRRQLWSEQRFNQEELNSLIALLDRQR